MSVEIDLVNRLFNMDMRLIIGLVIVLGGAYYSYFVYDENFARKYGTYIISSMKAFISAITAIAYACVFYNDLPYIAEAFLAMFLSFAYMIVATFVKASRVSGSASCALAAIFMQLVFTVGFVAIIMLVLLANAMRQPQLEKEKEEEEKKKKQRKKKA